MRLWLLAIAFFVACVPARKRVPGDVVRNINFTGNGGLFSGHDSLKLRAQMKQQSTRFGLMVLPLNYMVTPQPYTSSELIQDAYRLEVWYAHRGYFDARVTGFQARRVRKRKGKRAGVVDLRGFVEPGAPSLVRSFEIQGETRGTKLWANLVSRTALQRAGRQFDMDSAEADRAKLHAELQRHGYAYAQVRLAVDAHPTDHAVDVGLHMEPGPITTFGEITIEGNSAVKAKHIRQNLRITPGEPYRLDELVAAQNRLFAMNTFSLVTVRPDLTDMSKTAVPIKVTVTENRFRSIRFGLGLRTEGLRNWEPYVQARFRHTHLFHQLIRFELGTRFGLSGYSPSSLSDSKIFPTYKVNAAITYPRIAGQRVSQQLEAIVQRDVEFGLARYDNPEFDLRTIWTPSKALVIRLGPHFEYLAYVERDTLSIAQGLYGPDFDGTYKITSLDLGLTLDWRDDPLSSRRGSFLSTMARYAFPMLSVDDPHYFSFSGDWRIFRPVRLGRDVPITFASRLHGKIVVPIGDDGLPYPELAFLGGSTNMRGYPARGMGPYQTILTPTPDGSDELRFFLPEGGTLGLVLQEELRYHTNVGLTYAAFVDIGTLSSPFSVGTGRPPPVHVGMINGLRIAGGLGVRYGSPFGPARLDFAIRPRYSNAEDGCPTAINGEAGTCVPGSRAQRKLDVFRTLDRDSKWPGLMVFFALGESI